MGRFLIQGYTHNKSLLVYSAEGFYKWLFDIDDDALVAALEFAAFEGLPAQSAGRVRGPRHTPPSEPSVRQ